MVNEHARVAVAVAMGGGGGKSTALCFKRVNGGGHNANAAQAAAIQRRSDPTWPLLP